MKALLVRVGADQTKGGGRWNGLVDIESRRFVYVPIPETSPVHEGFERPYAQLEDSLAAFGRSLPPHLAGRRMHLDPDFSRLTYGDRGQRAHQLVEHVAPGDWLVFYASLVDVRARRPLVYALIGLIVVDRLMSARDADPAQRDINAHTRRQLTPTSDDIVVIGKSGGRLRECMPIGEYRSKAYRVREGLLATWGGLTVRNGWLQRSARLPRLLAPASFRDWFAAQQPRFVAANNPQ